MRSTLGSTIFAQRNALRLWLILGAMTIMVLGLGWFSRSLVQREIRHLVETNLVGTRQLLMAMTHAWANGQVGIAERTVSRPQLQRDLTAAFAGDAKSQSAALETLNGIAASARVAWWCITDASGTVVLAPDPAQQGRRLPTEAPLAGALAGPGRFSPAMRLTDVGLDKPLFLACVRLSVAGRDVVLVQAHDPAGMLSQVLAQAVSGESMEAYAFDEQGRMLSESRYLDELKASGRLPTDASSTIFTVELRNPQAPGADPSNPRSWPLTRMAADAIAGRSGVELDGYQDYRGTTAVAAWGWCPEHRLGLTVKLDRSEAYRALDRLTWLTVGLLALVLAAGAGFAVYLSRAALLSRRARHAEVTMRELGQYQLERKLGEGGMGAVYSATHRLLRRRTAVKLINGNVDADSQARFEREVRLCCLLSHPNTIAIYDYGRTAEGVFYYAMEHLDGADLETLVGKHGPMPAGRAIAILIQACGSLGEAHRAKLLHRDIKPANIFVTQRGGVFDYVKVLDFGLVKDLAKGGGTLSKADVISGTPPYMAPEVISQKPGLDGRVDLYALALVGVYLLTGKVPFERDGAMECIMAHLNEPLTALQPFGPMPEDLERVLLSCLALDPAARPADAEVFAAALAECADAGAWTQRHARSWWETNRPPSSEPASSSTDRRAMSTMAFT